MKKVLLIFAIGSFLVACNDSGTKTEPSKDSVKTAAPDTAAKKAVVDTSMKAMVDTAKKMEAPKK